MNWREGGRRVGLAISVIYWLIAAVVVGVVVNDQLLDKHRGVFGTPYQVYRYDWPNGAWGTVRAETPERADELVRLYSDYDPPALGSPRRLYSPFNFRPTFAKALATIGKTAGGFLLAYLLMAAIGRALGWIASGFIDKPAPHQN